MIGPLPYVGGKRRIARRIISLIPEHTTYVEPFAGGAQVFFHKPRSKVEVLNDVDEEVTNFLVVAQRHPTELARQLRFQPASRLLFEQHAAQSPELLTDVERAARFFYLQKNCWGGLRARPSFHFAVTKPVNYRPASIPERIRQTALRLCGAQIERASFVEVIRRYDRPGTFFYCDPPYVDLALYRHNFTDDDFGRLVNTLAGVKGKFLLSINDCPKAREWFGKFHCLPITLTYTSRRSPKQATELLYANYPFGTSLLPLHRPIK